MPLDEADLVKTLSRIFNSGPLHHLPARKAELDVLLALGAALFAAGKTYSERVVNEQLKEWLDAFASKVEVDHVTFRRCLVDLGFLVRDTAGSRYTPNKVRIDEVIADSTRRVNPGAVLTSLLQVREARKRQRGSEPVSGV